MKRIITLMLCVFLALLLSSCSDKSVEELYQLPKQSEDYYNLQNKIDEIIMDGAEFSAPTSGNNRQSVQLYDIDGDGSDEALAFFINASDEKPLKIYIFTQEGDQYETADIIEGEGTSIDSITYSDLTGDGISEIIVGWKTSDLQMLHVYTMNDFKNVNIVTESYTQYMVGDLTGNGLNDLIVLYHNTLESKGAVSLYTFDAYGQDEKYSADISSGIVSITDMNIGNLQNYYPALYIEGKYEEDKVITDIFAFTSGNLRNISADETGVSTATLTSYPASWTSAIGLMDINNDEIQEIPEPIMLSSSEELSTSLYVIRWYNFDETGYKKLAITTYHNYSDSWYIEIPDSWADDLALRRVDQVSGERAIVFSMKEENSYVDFMTIYALTGENKEDRAEIDNRIVLYSASDKIYAVEILSERSYSLSLHEILRRFNTISTSWD